ncbi:hypothetical protein NG895_19880 [Aeoliella sp. ICT_H6.2]|uniref:Uncharacterized protein n=1 Tax=Aeoliella straminimaris TaxID=2954799 RepID=A0A9X2JHU0_9BACT|nr:hypothetical protein [Aeoliella straminimaris]MCO6046166.1 hypothetical protein [Aeoliella straminimaris]
MRTNFSITWCFALAMWGALSTHVAAEETVENPFRTARWLATQPRVAQRLDAVTSESEPPGSEQYAEPQQVPITALGVNIALPAGKLPESEATGLVKVGPLLTEMPRPWPTLVYTWMPAATRHQPLYFEEINAERYGYSRNWVLQPVVSTAHFFGTIPALPYLMAANCPGECVYTLGHYRAGSCPPYRRHCWPCDLLGGTVEAGTIAWMIVVLP